MIREVPCRTVLNRTALGDYSLNCYVGCTHGCAYCYARFMQRFHRHDEPWARQLASFLAILVDAVTQVMPVRNGNTRIRCRAAACTGSIRASVTSKDSEIL